MDLFKQGMKGPARPAPSIPGHTSQVNHYSPVTNWNDDPFGADVFEPAPNYVQKKQPPPRPPPPKINSRQPDIPLKPSHFVRKPTVLSSLLSHKNKPIGNNQSMNVATQNSAMEFTCDLDTNKMFPKCEPKNIQTGTLIDLSSPPSSPTFTTRSSSDGLSVDSFGSDATTSTNNHNVLNGGNISQAESGFEDDFELFLHSRKTIAKEDTLEDFSSIDPFSPQPVLKPPLIKKNIMAKDLIDKTNTQATMQPGFKGPTIIRGKPARPKPPDNSSLLKNTFGTNFPVTSMNINTTTPIQKVYAFGENNSKSYSWDEDISPDRESSPPMPSIPPPPPPAVDEELTAWPVNTSTDFDRVDTLSQHSLQSKEPHAVALFDYFTDHPEDLCFSANSKIKLIRRVDEEWLLGSLRSGVQGVFPASYVEIKVPLPNESRLPTPRIATAVALYDFEPDQKGDLRFCIGDTISVISQMSDEWYFGECNGVKGHFPSNYVRMS